MSNNERQSGTERGPKTNEWQRIYWDIFSGWGYTQDERFNNWIFVLEPPYKFDPKTLEITKAFDEHEGRYYYKVQYKLEGYDIFRVNEVPIQPKGTYIEIRWFGVANKGEMERWFAEKGTEYDQGPPVFPKKR